MLRHTFCHLPGIGPTTEQSLWRRGFTTWQDVLACGSPVPSLRKVGCAELAESLQRFAAGDLRYFANRLLARERWRLFSVGRPTCAFLDIETTGLGAFADITTVAIHDGRQLRTFVAGQNLDDFPAALEGYELLVTYNGTSFDLPVIQQFFGIRLTQAHIDLRYVLASLGLKGGLKAVERRLGLERPGLEEVDGFFAVLLWHEYQHSGNPAALRTLLAYNVQDALNLEYLMVVAYNRKVAQTPFAHLAQPLPVLADNPFAPDPAVIARLRGHQIQPMYRSW